MADTVAGRVYLIRLALGDGLRTPLPMRDFAELLSSKGGKVYRSPQISGIETGQRALGLDEVEVFASVDPLQRGRAWLAFGDAPAAPAVPALAPPAHLDEIQMEDFSAGRLEERPRAATKRRRDQAG